MLYVGDDLISLWQSTQNTFEYEVWMKYIPVVKELISNGTVAMT